MTLHKAVGIDIHWTERSIQYKIQQKLAVLPSLQWMWIQRRRHQQHEEVPPESEEIEFTKARWYVEVIFLWRQRVITASTPAMTMTKADTVKMYVAIDTHVSSLAGNWSVAIVTDAVTGNSSSYASSITNQCWVKSSEISPITFPRKRLCCIQYFYNR